MTEDVTESWQLVEEERIAAETRRRLDGHRNRVDLPGFDPFDLAAVQAVAERIRLDFADTVCEGHRDNVGKCFSLHERECPHAKSNSCPKRVLEYEANLQNFRNPPKPLAEVLKGIGIPGVAAALIAAKEVTETESVKQAEAWWQSKPRPRVLVLNGYSQIGKTIAAAKLAADWSGRFVSVPGEFVSRMREPGYTDRLLIPGLLVLDDLGLERLDGFDDFKSRFDAVFCGRVDGGMFTVVTTNAGAQIRARYGDRIAERINRHGLNVDIAAPA